MHSLSDTVFVFDLDDTLFSERQYEVSGITAVWNYLNKFCPKIIDQLSLEMLVRSRTQWVELIIKKESENYIFSRDQLLDIYRNHFPDIELYTDSAKILSFLVENKANIEQLFDLIIISEEIGYAKPNHICYKLIEERFPLSCFVYIGDNPRKDFVAPNARGWLTYGLKDRGRNIHSQNVEFESTEYLPQIWLDSHIDLIPHIVV